MEIHVLDKSNSVINSYLAQMRSVDLQADRLRFRHNIHRIGSLMAYELSKSLNYATSDIQTPLGIAKVNLPQDQIVVGTILRAGLPMHNGVLDIFDSAENCFVSASRASDDSHDVEIHNSYATTPRLDGKTLIIADPMLATAKSMVATLRQLLKFGKPAHIHVLSIIGAQPGVDFLAKSDIGVPTTLWVATVDQVLNADSYIVPGLGDAGDLAFGSKL